ncbi:hypothetical protein CALVIDRAFT_538168 [Calocera viscosa TUFC12733]|uniref:Uncharacterized protein n=1 Tax=Calocera viscosa (strain TUFC12733) TaxID=1330018 RepID=A0A167L6X8_CALVF|nr:hypothetical protein CALVIDRAFT_538168 [Calocera viscosa TUFC12733]
MLEELERAERAAKRSKLDTALEEKRRREEEERIKWEGRRRREEAERAAAELLRAREAAAEGKGDPLELTLLLRLPHPAPSAPSLLAALSKLGPVDPQSLILRPAKPKPGKKQKGGTAVVQFLTRKGALAASQAGGRRDLGEGWEGVRVEWAGGEPEWARKALEEPMKHKEVRLFPFPTLGPELMVDPG